MSRGHVSGNLQAGVQPLQAFPTGQALNGYAEHVYTQPEGEPPIETNAIRQWRDWPGLRNGQLELRLNNQRAPRVHGLGWGYDPDAEVWRPVRVDSTGALVVSSAPAEETPLHSNFALFAFVHTINASKTESLGVRTLPMNLFPATLGGLTRVVRLRATLATNVIGADVTASLVDISQMVPTTITNSTLTHNGLAPTEVESPLPGLPVADAPGSLYVTGSHLYQLTITTPPGVKCILSGAWVSVDYE